jgi:DNA-binding transcriptional ArsR family regulator
MSCLDNSATCCLDHDGLHGGEPTAACEWATFPVCSETIDRSQLTDYDAAEVLEVRDPEQLRALAGDLRARIVVLLRERAASTTELATALGVPKGTAGHHVKVLERAGLIRVVATRRVRAVTERYYGRVARLFVLKPDELPRGIGEGALAAMMLRQAADELLAAGDQKDTSAFVHVRLSPADLRRFQLRINRLIADYQRADDPNGEAHALTMALFRATTSLPPRDDDA